MFERSWRYDEVDWGATLCSARCGRPAELLYAETPLCCADADRLLQRQQLQFDYPEIAASLPPVFRADED